jgi:tetratricopeptide (TPR) repeat protein
MITTENGRGTQGYRAPELMSSANGFTNKADIWALGCILYELMTGTKAFDTDWSVWGYYVSDSALEILVPGLSQILQTHLSAVTDELLQRDYKKRPSAARLQRLFHSYFISNAVLSMDITKREIPLPPYQTWKEIVGDCETHCDIGSQLVDYFKSVGHYDCAIFSGILVVSQGPGGDVGEKFGDALNDALAMKDNKDATIAVWRRVTEMFPRQEWPHRHLTAACKSKGGDVLAREIWGQLCISQPENAVFKTRYEEAIARMYLAEGDFDSAIFHLARVVCSVVSMNLKKSGYMELLAHIIWERYHLPDKRIAACADLIERYPTIPDFQEMLSKAIEHPDVIVGVWEKLVEKHPRQSEFRNRLSSACNLTGCSREAIEVWEGLADRAAGSDDRWPFNLSLKRALGEKGDVNRAVVVWKRLSAKQPEYWCCRQLSLALQSSSSSVDEVFAVWKNLAEQHPSHWAIRHYFDLAYQPKHRRLVQ